MPLNEKKVAALLKGTVEEKWIVIVPPDSTWVTGAEKTRVRTPPLLVTSASLVYVLVPPVPVSSTVTVELVGSIATVTKIVFPDRTLEDGLTSALPVEVSLAVPRLVGPTVARMVTLNAPEDSETFPAASVA